MKTFSFFLSLVISITFFFCLPYYNASAQDNYLRVITDDTPFYKNITDDTPLFYLPYTYYVKVLESANDYTHVEVYGVGGIAAIDGFVPTHFLYKDNLAVDNPFVVLTITTTDTATLYSDQNATTQIQYIFPDRQLSFYGTLPASEGNLYYVGYNGKLGYVKESFIFPFSIPNHPNELTFLSHDKPNDNNNTLPENGEENGFLELKIAIIICLVFAGVIGLFVALKVKPQKNVAVSFYDENDYE